MDFGGKDYFYRGSLQIIFFQQASNCRKKEEKQEYHFDEFDTIIVSSSDVNFSVLLMQSLIEEEKTIIVCDSRRFPSVSMLPMFGTQDCFCRLTEQMSWPQVAKDEVWCGIVENKIENQNYRNLLRNEYRVIKVLSKKILKNAQIVYSHKIHNGNKTNLCKRCNDFLLLEEKAKEYNNS